MLASGIKHLKTSIEFYAGIYISPMVSCLHAQLIYVAESITPYYSQSRFPHRGASQFRARIVSSTLRQMSVMMPDRESRQTYTANVPALTGIARARVGPMPFQNPLAPSACHVLLKQSRIVLYF